MALILIIPSMIASVIGTYLTTLVDARILVTIFCVMLTLISFEMLIPAFRFLWEIRWGPSFALTIRWKTRVNDGRTYLLFSSFILGLSQVAC